MSALTRPEATSVVRRLVAFYGQELGRRWSRRYGKPDRERKMRVHKCAKRRDIGKAPDEDDVRDQRDEQDPDAGISEEERLADEELPRSPPLNVQEMLQDEGLRSIVLKHRQDDASEVDVGATVLEPVMLRVKVLAHLRKTYDVLFPSNIVPITRTVEQAATFVLDKLRPPKMLLSKVKETAPPNLKIFMREQWRAGSGTKVDIPQHVPKRRVR